MNLISLMMDVSRLWIIEAELFKMFQSTEISGSCYMIYKLSKSVYWVFKECSVFTEFVSWQESCNRYLAGVRLTVRRELSTIQRVTVCLSHSLLTSLTAAATPGSRAVQHINIVLLTFHYHASSSCQFYIINCVLVHNYPGSVSRSLYKYI